MRTDQILLPLLYCLFASTGYLIIARTLGPQLFQRAVAQKTLRWAPLVLLIFSLATSVWSLTRFGLLLQNTQMDPSPDAVIFVQIAAALLVLMVIGNIAVAALTWTQRPTHTPAERTAR